VTVAYVPYGFYYTQPTVWATETVVVERPVYVREEVPVYVPEGAPAPAPTDPLVRTSEYREPAPAAPGPVNEAAPATPDATQEPKAPIGDGPPVLDEATEKLLREGSKAFAEARYSDALESFRMAVVASPEAVGPRFAFGQTLLAMGDYPYAARVLREALTMEPAILNAPGSIAGVYRDQAEFDRVLAALRVAVLEKRDDADRLFLLGYQQYFSGDSQCAVTFARMRERFPEDPSPALFEPAMQKRFPALSSTSPAGSPK